MITTRWQRWFTVHILSRSLKPAHIRMILMFCPWLCIIRILKIRSFLSLFVEVKTCCYKLCSHALLGWRGDKQAAKSDITDPLKGKKRIESGVECFKNWQMLVFLFCPWHWGWFWVSFLQYWLLSWFCSNNPVSSQFGMTDLIFQPAPDLDCLLK